MQSLIKLAILTLLAFFMVGCSQPNQSVKSVPETTTPVSNTPTHIQPTPTITISPTSPLIASATSTSVPLTTPIPNTTGLTIEENEIIGQASLDPLTFQPVHGSQQAVQARHAQQKEKPYSFPGGFEENGAYAIYPLSGDLHFKAVRASDSAMIVLQQDGKTILNVDGGDVSPITPLRGLWVDDEQWTLEIASVTNIIKESSVNSVAVGQIYQDGKFLNDLYGYEEMFGFQMFNDKPFYFYKKDGKIHLSYNNEDLPILYDEVPHYGCCSSAELNPIAASNWIGFWGQRDGVWYYTEIGRYGFSPSELPSFTILYAAQGEDSERLRQVVYELKTDLPVGPANVMLYRQKQSQTKLTAENAAAVAAKTGIRGSVDSYTGEGGDTVYTVTDGKGEVLVFSDAPLEFTYSADNVPVSGNPEKLYSFAERAQAAVDFLEAHQLLDFEYRVEPNGNPNWAEFSVAIAPSLDGHFLYENNSYDPRIFVAVDVENKVHIAIYRSLAFQPLHEVKVRQADEVWADFLAGRLNERSYVRWVNQTGDPSKMTEAINSSTLAAVEKAELVYFAIDMRGMSARAIPQDDPARVVLPV